MRKRKAAVPEAEWRLINEMVVARGRLGRKNGKGFYDYPESAGAKKKLWPGLEEIFPQVADPDGHRLRVFFAAGP